MSKPTVASLSHELNQVRTENLQLQAQFQALWDQMQKVIEMHGKHLMQHEDRLNRCGTWAATVETRLKRKHA